MEVLGMIVLDTHTLLWMGSRRSGTRNAARKIIQRSMAQRRDMVSAISFWEVACWLGADALFCRFLFRVAVRLLQGRTAGNSADGASPCFSTQLDKLHRDSRRSFHWATALQYQATLVTADSKILAWKSELARQDARN